MKRLAKGIGVFLLAAASFGLSGALAAPPDARSGTQIMAEVARRHRDFPRVFEIQTMILTDRQGRKDTRKLRRFYAIEPDQSEKLLMAIDQPAEVRGVILKLIQTSGKPSRCRIFLPALGRDVSAGSDAKGQGIMGTDLTLADLMEDHAAFEYARKKDLVMSRVPYFVVEGRNGNGVRVHFIRKDNFVITRTDFYTPGLRLVKRLSRHDLRQTDQAMWHAGMVLMENLQTGHATLIKTDRLVLSRDYVPDALFDMDWQRLTRYLYEDTGPSSEQEPGINPEPQNPKGKIP